MSSEPNVLEMTARDARVEEAEEAKGLLSSTQAVETEFWQGVKTMPPIAEVAEVDHFNIEGGDLSQILQIRVRPGETITTEPGTLVLMSDGLKPAADVGSCQQGCVRVCCARESFYRLKFINRTDSTKFLGISPSGPGKIIPNDLTRFSGFTFKSGVFLAAVGTNWRIRLRLVDNTAAGCCAGQGFILNELHGDGMAFLIGCGAIEHVMLGPGEKYVVDRECLLAFQKGVKFDVRIVGCNMACCCGELGLFQAVLTGPGLVLVESLPLARFRHSMWSYGRRSGHTGGSNAA